MQSPDKPSILKQTEFTIRAAILGVLLSIILGAANVYLGLYAGMTVSASIPAAVISMAILRGLFKRGTVQENNIVQSIASAGETLAAGIIFTMPALLLTGVWQNFDYITVTLIAISGGLIGIVFMIPLRAAFIEGRPDLTYPEGVACASVLEAGESGKVKALTIGASIAVVMKMATGWLKIIPGKLTAAFVIPFDHQRLFAIGSDISTALLGVGYIVRFHIAVQIFIGGAIAWFFALPLLTPAVLESSTELMTMAQTIWSEKIKYIGVGAMAVAGFLSLIEITPTVYTMFKKNFLTRKDKSLHIEKKETSRDISGKVLIVLMSGLTLLTFGIYFFLLNSVLTALLFTAVMLFTGFIFTGVATYIVGLVGSSNTPVSGMTISVLLFTGGLLFFTDLESDAARLALLGVAGVVCSAVCTASDIAQDLKTGQLVKATPARQQWGEILGVIAAAFIMAPVLQLLQDVYGIGTGGENSLTAPQASLFASLSEGLTGSGELPYDHIFTGAVLAVVLYILDKMFGEKFNLHVMPVAVGIYLPINLSVTILLGGLLDLYINKVRPAWRDTGVLAASGLIAGEALTGIVLALFMI